MSNSNPYGGSPFDQKIFTIPCSGAVRLWGPEVDVISTPEFQRLAGLKQLGTAYLVFRGAMHTRFEHSLGTLHEAQRIIEAVNRNPASPEEISGRERQLIRMAALLHDVTHIPFGHSLEDEFDLLSRHDANTERLERLVYSGRIGRILIDGLGHDWFEEFCRVLEVKGDEEAAELDTPFAADVIGNTVCADMLDYVPRDLNACGMPALIGDRFLEFFTITPDDALRRVDRRRMALNLDKRGMPRPDVESEVIKLLSHRYELVERVYFHHAKNSGSVMLARAVWEAGFVGDSPGGDDTSFDWLTDETLLLCLSDYSIARALGVSLKRRSESQRALASELSRRIRERDLYKIAYLGVYDELADQAMHLHDAYSAPAKRRELEDDLAAAGGLEPGRVLVHLPAPDMLLKLAAVRVLTHRRRVITLEEWDSRHSGRATALNDAHRRLWRATVYTHPDASDAQKALVRAASEEAFGAPSRYIKPPRAGAYVKELFDQNAAELDWSVDDWRIVEESAALSFSRGSDDALAEMKAIIESGRDTGSE